LHRCTSQATVKEAARSVAALLLHRDGLAAAAPASASSSSSSSTPTPAGDLLLDLLGGEAAVTPAPAADADLFCGLDVGGAASSAGDLSSGLSLSRVQAENPIEVERKNPIAFKRPVLSFLQDPIAFKRPVLSFLRDPIAFKRPVLSFLRDPIEFKRPVLSFFRDPY
jgi:hypothetical protein